VYGAFRDKKVVSKPRSGCPVCVSLEQFGDRWSLLIIRDLMVRGYRTFREFQQAGEGIATNGLSSRLHRLTAHGIIEAEPATSDGRSIHYRLTPKGIALAPVMLELLIWAARHDETAHLAALSRRWNRIGKPCWTKPIAVGNSGTQRR
jgi:DNA-binding HxlR family transcriptional regulator